MTSAARWTVQQLLALHAATVRELERLHASVEGDRTLSTLSADALTDGRAFAEQLHRLRRSVEHRGLEAATAQEPSC